MMFAKQWIKLIFGTRLGSSLTPCVFRAVEEGVGAGEFFFYHKRTKFSFLGSSLGYIDFSRPVFSAQSVE